MSQFDIKRYEQNEKRKVVVRQIEALPFIVRNNILQIIGIEGKRSDYFQTCITCEHWSEPKELCKKFNVRPPANVIVDGCDSYQDYQLSDIPF